MCGDVYLPPNPLSHLTHSTSPPPCSSLFIHRYGDPNRLVYPKDYEGNYCGAPCVTGGDFGKCKTATAGATMSCGCIEKTETNKTLVYYPKVRDGEGYSLCTLYVLVDTAVY